MYFVYILQSLLDKKFYIGFTHDIKSRFLQHQKGGVKSTKNRRPLDLVYYEAFKREEDARRQEIFYKTSQGRRILRKRIQPIIGGVA